MFQERVRNVGFRVNRAQRTPDRNLAWILATSPKPRLRSGAESLRLAKLCWKTKVSDPRTLSTLAAAYAETGDYASAAATARKALSHVRNPQKEPELAAEIETALRCYAAKQPYRAVPAPSPA